MCPGIDGTQLGNRNDPVLDGSNGARRGTEEVGSRKRSIQVQAPHLAVMGRHHYDQDQLYSSTMSAPISPDKYLLPISQIVSGDTPRLITF